MKVRTMASGMAQVRRCAKSRLRLRRERALRCLRRVVGDVLEGDSLMP